MVRRCRRPKISIRLVISVRAVRTQRSEYAFARGLRGGIFATWMEASARTASKRRGELTGTAADQEPEVCSALAQVHQQVADLLGGPGPSGFAVTPRMCT
jgi:hypothetical protein